METHYQKLNLFFEIDLSHIAEKTEEGLWLVIFHQIYSALCERKDIIKILKEYDERDLRKIFKNTAISKNIKIFGQDSSEEYFYGNTFQKISNIQAFFYGIIDILMEKKILTIIAIDEVQQIEKWGDPIFQAFLESFVSSTYDKYMSFSKEAYLFFILSFLLKSPASRDDKYAFLEKQSPGFVSRMKGREIILCEFTESEHNKALKLCADITNLTPQERKKFEAEIKSKLTYWMTRSNPREFGKYIQEIYKKLGFLKLSPSEKRQIYEKEGREFVKPLLLEKGFTYIADKPEPIEGYNFDVYAENRSRNIIKKCAFGEIKTTQRKKLKGEVERFSTWLNNIKKTSLYNHPDNFYFFISSYEPTSGSKEILEQYSINWIKFYPPELIFAKEPELEEKPKVIPKKKKKREKVPEPLVKISEKTPLKKLKISGLGQARKSNLEIQGIITIHDLKEADLEDLASNIRGISKRMLLDWKGECEKFLNP